MPAHRVIGLRFWRNDDHQTNGLLGIGSESDKKNTSLRGFAGSMRHALMHRGHASFGHIADFGGMGLQELYDLGIAGGLDDGNAGVGDFDLGFNLVMEVKKRI